MSHPVNAGPSTALMRTREQPDDGSSAPTYPRGSAGQPAGAEGAEALRLEIEIAASPALEKVLGQCGTAVQVAEKDSHRQLENKATWYPARARGGHGERQATDPGSEKCLQHA